MMRLLRHVIFGLITFATFASFFTGISFFSILAALRAPLVSYEILIAYSKEFL